MQTIIELKGVRLIKKGDKLECVTYSDTIIEINPKYMHTEELQKWMAVEETSEEEHIVKLEEALNLELPVDHTFKNFFIYTELKPVNFISIKC
ncbi:hypothetical protein DAPPUDRAFT_246016 [Daphnia pulex]|uniref:Uncharacterized protein n=1 Tax=Daphnia pulex TaxID=6669 RepID=E9GPH0_DAPPU|nr:hypothetical protein DAPPUDRAFT_246016 [Daphnia pulex]|eukprot:EFX78636.1 hypothetical protein DAPPUDRAFT_246016 [Daphnia pulex]